MKTTARGLWVEPVGRRSRFGIGFSVVLGFVLLGAVVIQYSYALREVPLAKPRERLAMLVPNHAGEWSGREEPLGATETVNEAVLKTLNLDDYIHRRFSRGGKSFTVYAAYWAPGRMPTRLVASHTPDRCWTENGMRCVDMRFRETYRVDGKPLLPAEYRVFVMGVRGTDGGPMAEGRRRTPEGATQTYVAYWHTVEGKLYDYGDGFNAMPHPWLWWKDTVAQAMQGSREQLFARIASETLFEELWKEPGFVEVMRKVADLGLWAPDRTAED